MIQLSDEILNKYIDGELDQSMLNEVREQLKNSEHDQLRLSMLQKVHKELGRLETYEVSRNFTASIMSKIQKKAKVVWKDRIFIIAISSLFLILALSIVGYLLFSIISQPASSTQDSGNIKGYLDLVNNFSATIKSLMTSKNISIFGSILSFGIIISGYMFYENQRHSKRNLGKLH